MTRRSSPVRPGRFLTLTLALACAALAGTASAVIHLDTGDPSLYTSTSGDNSGWQYEGNFGGYLGTPIAPHYFLTASHIYRAGDTFVFHGETFTVLDGAGYFDPSTDLHLWKVDHAFATYAPLFQPRAPGNTETGRELRTFGCGTQRGDPITFDGTLRGWAWGPGDGVQRWGRNTVAAVVRGDPDNDQWLFLQAPFDSPGLPGESHLSVGDSGGGVFVLQDGLWRLAGINYAVDDLYTTADGGGHFAAAIFDARGYYTQTGPNSYALITGADNVPTSSFATQVSSRLAWLQSIVGDDADLTALPPESFDQWSHAYFTPDALADDTVSGPDADPDGDGVPNLLEYAFNLDPTYPEPVVMTADTGLRGLPLVRLESVADADRRLTVEFVRRTAAGGADVDYAVQFTSSLDPVAGGWQAGGTASVTAINARWERVKVTDDVPVGGAVAARFARVVVTRHDAGRPLRGPGYSTSPSARRSPSPPNR